MRLHVRHQTSYSYDSPVAGAIQTLRLTPRSYEGLRIVHWRVWSDTRRELPIFVDGYGNLAHSHAINHLHASAVVFVEGEVETATTNGIVRGAPEPLPPLFFLRCTKLTRPDDAITALARQAVPQGSVLKQLHALLIAVRERLDYLPGATETVTPAAEALAAGAGVCQDHAHLFIAAARVLGIPARYIGGYLWTGVEAREYQATHGWAEAFVHDLGWVGFDPANRICPTEAYIRTSVGLDYWSAAPVRGVRRGTAAETLAVAVNVTQAGGAQ